MEFFDRWRLKLREKPLGGFLLHLFATDFGFGSFMLLGLVAALTSYLGAVSREIRSQWDGEFCFECSDFSTYLNPWWLAFFVLASGLIAASFWKSRHVRHFISHYVLPFLGLIAGCALLMLVWHHKFDIWFFIALGSIKLGVLGHCFFELESTRERHYEQSEPLGTRTQEGAGLLLLAWLGVLAFGASLWSAGAALMVPMRSVASAQISEMPGEVQAWSAAIEAKDIQRLRSLLVYPKAAQTLSDPVWGKFVFFAATDSSPEVLEVLLSSSDIPKEFVEHSFPRLASGRNCSAFHRLIRYAEGRGINKPADLVCATK